MKREGLTKSLILCLICGFLVTGCGEQTVTPEIVAFAETNNRQTMLDAPEIAYEKEEMLPSILVDLVGYLPTADKIAVIEAEILPGEFDLVNAETGEVVFTGEVRKKQCTEDGEKYTGYADFTEYTEEGSYYIETELLGRSRSFAIKKGIYDELFDRTIEGLRSLKDVESDDLYLQQENAGGLPVEVSGGWYTSQDGGKDVCVGCLSVLDLITAYEYFPKAYTDESGNGIPDILDEVIFETEWLMKMQNHETGGVYTAVSTLEEKPEAGLVVMGETTRATAYYCASLAHFSYVIKKYDPGFSTKCIEAAGEAWKCLEANKDLVAGTQMFRAAVEMYRATGNAVYRKVVEDYLKDNYDKDYEERIALDGAIVYMSSSRATVVNYCTGLMEHYMSRTENKSNAANASRYLVESAGLGEEELLRNLVEIIIVDFIISNAEYGTIEENYLHYFCGRNPGSTIMDGMKYNPDAYAEFIVLLGKLKMMHQGE